MHQLTKGATLQGGKYIIERVLGQGGFGITYLAENTYFDKKVAIKEFFPKDYCSRDENTGYVTMLRPEMKKHKKKFISEANKIAQLSHKGIIKVIEVFEENGTAYYAMDYIAGQSLWELLQQRQFSVKESLQIIEKVSKALAHIHSKRMLHLDIKPHNIMLRSNDNEPIIIDFGISKTYDSRGEANTTFLPAYSLGYSPAEQLAGEVNTFAPQLDIYSLGATFYTILTRSVPTYPTPLTVSKLTFDSSIPFYVEKAVKTAMAYRQEERYATVKDFLVALDLASPSSSKKSSVVESKIKADKPIIKSFGIKKDAPYYVNEEIELSWWVQNCERVYLNGQLQSGFKKTKQIVYDSPGKKRFTLKAVKGDDVISRTRIFDVKQKTDNEKTTSHNSVEEENDHLDQLRGDNFGIISEKPSAKKSSKINSVESFVGKNDESVKNDVNYKKSTEKNISKHEETKVIIADVVEKKPEIIFFRRVGNEKVYVGDKIPVYWEVKGASDLIIDDWFIPIKPNKAEITVRVLGTNTIKLTAHNSAGTVSKSIKVQADRRPSPPRITHFGIDKKDKVYVGDTVKLSWTAKNCRETRLGRHEVVSAEDSRVLTYDREGSYAYTLHAINKDGQDTKTIHVIVHKKPLSHINLNVASSLHQREAYQNETANSASKNNWYDKIGEIGLWITIVGSAIGWILTFCS